jgi:hypothetical protein
MPLQTLTLKLDGITAGDYLTWCRDPDPPALDFALRSICIDADPLGDTITAILDWNQPRPTASAAATAAGLPLSAGVQILPLLTDASHQGPVSTEPSPHPTCASAVPVGAASVDPERRLACAAGSKVGSAQRSNTASRETGWAARASKR